MSLAAQRSSRQREDFVMRLGSLLVSLAVLASLVLEPPRAKAFALTSSAVTALAGGFLYACGLAPVVSGMSSSGEVNESLARLIQEYLTAEVPGVDIVNWLGDLSLQVNSGNKLIIPAAAAGALSAFAQWVAGKYGTKPGETVITPGVYPIFSNHSITAADGTTYMLSLYGDIQSASDGGTKNPLSSDYVLGTSLPFGTSESDPVTIELYPGYGIQLYEDGTYRYYRCFSGGRYTYWTRDRYSNRLAITFISNPFENGAITYSVLQQEGLLSVFSYTLLPADIAASLMNNEDLSLDVSENVQQILDRLTALEEGQSIALDVGATQSMEIQEILQGILDAILAGDLTASAEIVDTAEVPVEPEEPDPPIVPELPSGLDKLGAALTSRFPFSIPWDVYKGVKLLAAPAKAPYFEVDFLAPIADRVGGWKGSTKIVLDFSEYEIIGQVCRWTSTIGFCLMLASGTKRLIWTA